MLCPKCQSFWQAALSASQIPESITSLEDVRWKPYYTVLHKSISELKHSSDLRCPICRAILFTPTQFERDSLLGDDDEAVDVVLELDPDKGPHPVLSATFREANSAKKEARVPKRMVATWGGALNDEDLAATLDSSARLDNNSTGSDASFELASFWLKRCLSQHEKCRQASTGTQPSFVPTRLIDVSNNAFRLVESKKEIKADGDRRFVALSHCWGLIPIIRTLGENYEDHMKNIDPTLLSKTFREAVHATRKLGFRYIWIDSLCIVQDSKSDWEAEAVTMCDVYREASLTIAAAHAPGGDVGCFQDRDGLLQFPFVLDLPQSEAANEGGSQKPTRVLFTSYGRSQGLGGPEPPLYGRSWTFQEQLLSPRMLIYDGSQLRWECLCNHGSERSPQGGMSRHIGHQATIRTGINDDIEFFSLPGIDDPKFAARAQLQHWVYAVMDYTHRGMTIASDRLVAIAGVAQALARHTSKQYYAGLWEQDFWLGLLWSISHSNEYTGTVAGAFDLERNKHVRHEEDLAPSWSWVSVTVPVVYPVPTIMNMERICDVLTVQVSGTPAKQSGKVEIRGHVRTGYVHPFYQYAIQEAAEAAPNMTVRKPDGSKNMVSYRGRAFHANDYFILSDTKPTSTLSKISSASWRLVRGTFRPDEIIDPSTQITFIAISQRNSGSKPESLVATHKESDPLQVWALALVPTGRMEGEYKRVGYSVWEDCSWYGYMCGHKVRPGREIEKGEGWRGVMSMGDLEHMGWSRSVEGKGAHPHRFQGDALPDRDKYHEDVDVEQRVITIV